MGIIEHELKKYDLWVQELDKKKKSHILCFILYVLSIVYLFTVTLDFPMFLDCYVHLMLTRTMLP
jgi:hypothetical protein